MLEFLDAVNLGWLFVAIALIGQILVANGNNLKGFCFWILSNSYLFSINYYNKNYDQAFLFSIYTIICMYGIYKQLKLKKVKVQRRYN